MQEKVALLKERCNDEYSKTYELEAEAKELRKVLREELCGRSNSEAGAKSCQKPSVATQTQEEKSPGLTPMGDI